MTAPNRQQISADVTSPTFDVLIKVGGSWVSRASLVKSATSSVMAGGGAASGVAMGPAVYPEATLELDTSARSDEVDRLPVRIDYGFATSDLLTTFNGALMSWRGSGAGATRTWELRGVDALIEGCEVRTHVLRRRPIFTKTTISSVEDPTLSTCRSGLGNQILWQCGGRPYEQAASYPDATFYYSCTQALIAPEWTWAPGENPWELLRKLCRAAGGQVYIDGAGTVRYVDPITLATGTPTFTFTDAVQTAAQREANGTAGFEDILEDHDGRRAITGATCNYVSRLVQGDQVAYEQTVPLELAAAGDVNGEHVATFDCDIQLPLYTCSGVEIDAAIIRAARAIADGDVTISYDFSSAQRVSVTLTNTLSDRVQVWAVRVRGRPIAASEPGSAVYLSASGRVVTVEDSPFIQSQRHAAMLARMLFDAEATSGTTYTLTGCAFDPDRAVGEVVYLTYSPWSLSNVRCRIVKITPKDGAWMDVELAPLGSLPTSSSVHLVGAVSGTKDLAY